MDNQETLVQRAVINESMFDSKTGEFGKGYSPDYGQTFIVQEGTDGRHYHQETDPERISELVFDSFKLKSPNGTIWKLSIDDEGNLIKEKEES
ncbi:hypothetical protein DKZ22_12200 [Limosilactobacillus reuteri]|uniref:Uncharacterized protein n=1 Tax=Limosilactobacillus reuteri TaxID=1598 RepID=A0A855XGT7_LIMRT|nr:hypothetical protein [Limosilactobacillus reuteri]PWT35192.1 hypothetical protein DKZ24_05030 [Limosilactobacillus reuteri]PWT38881.1 hypothetical protein DKZ22_12200 [Limosilactobacillus reuteri]PWT53604.1 hypothetical protein DKZ31_07965 [Limosilactobacillus reuteri]PWT59810.1 hypothetical protein DKZ30_04985 [Limosilactobacillus reuteri]PWT64510.1 hypothetical protein DKZ20_05070 [Limosilactobacillus reuteri]